jgi:acyl-CoA thioesterase I
LNCPASPPVFSANGWKQAFTPHGAAPLRVLAIGSSSTQGIGASAPSSAYPARLAADLRNLLDIKAEVRNAGIAGETAKSTVARLKTLLMAGGSDLVIWQVGTNDAVIGASDMQFRATLDEGLDAAHSAQVPIILLDPQYYPGIKDPTRYARYVAMIGEEGATHHTPVFSRYAMMKAWEQNSASDLRDILSPDHFHMGDRGYACLARALATSIKQGAEPFVLSDHPDAPSDAKKL